uniref:Uncharacterized protein n=1 Tax=Panagrolaimus davidi TaxID=227884 RepID=A0A914QNT9_9BILA
MKLTLIEYSLLRLLLFLTPVPGLSPQGKKIIKNASKFYREILVSQILKTTNNSIYKAMERMGTVMKFLYVMEEAKCYTDQNFSVMTLFNIADVKGELPYEVHIRKGLKN